MRLQHSLIFPILHFILDAWQAHLELCKRKKAQAAAFHSQVSCLVGRQYLNAHVISRLFVFTLP